jgi:histidyl-tRNA synthetase
MNEYTYLITFDDASPADANQYTDELRNAILDATPDIMVRRKRSDSHAQDFGATLILILGTPAAAAVVTAIGNWLKLRQSASITWKTENEQILVQNITSRDAVQLAQLLLTKNEG